MALEEAQVQGEFSVSVYAPYLSCDIWTRNWLYHAWVRENCRLEGFSWCKPSPFGQWSQS